MAGLGSVIAALGDFQKGGNIYDPYKQWAPGTKLINLQEMEEAKRQSRVSEEQWSKEFVEQQRQFNEEMSETKRQHNLSAARSGTGGSNPGASITDSVAARLATVAGIDAARELYNTNRTSGKNKRLTSADSGYDVGKHPLFHAVNSVLYDPQWQGDRITYNAKLDEILNGLITSTKNAGQQVTPASYIAYLEASGNPAYMSQAEELRRALNFDK